MAAVAFTFLDWLWVLIFILIMVICGVLFYHLGKRSEADFFLAGRGLPWWLPATSVYATHTATDTPMWVSGVIYKHGLRGLWYTFFCGWCAISAFVSSRIFRRSLAYTQAEWQTLRYSGLGAELLRGWLAGFQVYMNMFIMGWVSFAMGKVCNYFFGWPYWVGMVVPTALCAIYVTAAGYWGVVMADFQQGIIAFLVIVIVSLWGVYAAGGPHAVVQKLHQMGQAWRLNPFAVTGWTTGDFPVAWLVTMLIIAIIGGFGMGTTIDWYTEAQRAQSARTVRDACYSIWWGTALVLMRNSLWAVAVLGFFVLFPHIKEAKVYEMAWFRIADFLPAGMVGFFFAAILAIHLSTISTQLNLGASYAVRDLYHHYINPKATERQLVRAGRVSTLILLIGAYIYGWMMMRTGEEVTSWLLFALWLMLAGLWLPSILQVVWWRFNSWGYLTSWIASLILSWLITWVLPSLGVIPPLKDLKDYQIFWVLFVLGLLIYIPVTLLTPPEDMDRLVRFYVMSRPLGWWGPVRREAERRGLIEPRSEGR